MKKTLLITSVALVITIISGCFEKSPTEITREREDLIKKEVIDRTKPGVVLLEFLNKMTELEFKAAYNLLALDDQKAAPYEKWLKRVKEQDAALLRYVSEYEKHTKIAITKTSINNPNAELEVLFVAPKLTSKAASEIWVNPTHELADLLIIELSKKQYETVSVSETYHLKLDKNIGWGVFTNLEGDFKVGDLEKEAKNYHTLTESVYEKTGMEWALEKQQLVKAKNIYTRLSELRPGNYDYLMKDVAGKLKAAEDYENYLTKIEIKNISVGRTSEGGKGVFGELKNNTNKELMLIAIRVYLLDKDGKPCSEYDFTPVLKSKYSSRGDTLKPNYSKSFGYKLKNPPSVWSGEVEVIISGVEV